MKKPLLLLALLCSLFLAATAQKFEGTWKGTMIQDSPVVRIDFEMVLEQKEGKINGYLYRLFIVNDSLIYNTVRVTARVSGNMLIVEDDESVSRNFDERANRKIKAAYFFNLNPKQPDADTMSGEWTTSRFRNKYMSISGKVKVKKEPLYETTQLFKRLEEKQLHRSIAFVPGFKVADVAVNKPKSNPATATKTEEPVKQEPTIASKSPAGVISKEPEVITKQPASTGTVKKDTVQTTASVQKQPETKPINQNNTTITAPVVKKDSAQSNTVVKNSSKPVTEPKNNSSVPVAAPPKQQPTVAANNQPKPAPQNNAQPVTVQKPVQQPPIVQQPVVTKAPEKTEVAISKPNEAVTRDSTAAIQKPGAPPVINNPAITKRETEVIQTLSVFEDSVTLALYDNGEIDGDTVSVFLNNEKIINNIGLKASAYKHTVYFKKGEIVQLTLFAENLGSIPPNSGLLVVYSGDQRYQVFFTSTLNKSAVVLLKRE
ncbi:hypothetical protein PDL71_01675 [Lacibacter sp. MH-610]|uniref:hypothetical protein n=1 Tax=Lacibacter sp. MH-610 TaxID=3020883 RepID=UPI003892C6DE